MRLPQTKSIEPRSLSLRERSWIGEILENNPQWADVDLTAARVIAQCDCGKCKTVFLESPSPQNPSLAGTKGWIGRIDIRTTDDFGIMVALDQNDGNISGLYIEAVDLREPGDRPFPDDWCETAHVITPM